jgi:hypothetical protein
MEDSGFRRSLTEMRAAGSHLWSAGALLVAATRETAGALLARAWDSRVLVSVRRRVEQWRSLPGTRPELVRISLKEQAKVIDTVARRLSTSRDELEELSRLVEGIEERFVALPKERTA